jgi:hypothetical protein
VGLRRRQLPYALSGVSESGPSQYGELKSILDEVDERPTENLVIPKELKLVKKKVQTDRRPAFAPSNIGGQDWAYFRYGLFRNQIDGL